MPTSTQGLVLGQLFILVLLVLVLNHLFFSFISKDTGPGTKPHLSAGYISIHVLLVLSEEHNNSSDQITSNTTRPQPSGVHNTACQLERMRCQEKRNGAVTKKLNQSENQSTHLSSYICGWPSCVWVNGEDRRCHKTNVERKWMVTKNIVECLRKQKLSLSGTVKLEVRVDGKRTPAALQEWAGQGGGCLQPAI
ncbi:hypothetical protein EV424DRAFT_1347517 [Suillus variegatus]|nr:hypothetical protein EV424DRAFT_1347496 [Suillus variegatus]KAG1818945.1 hypothetical protein EV424DRAFT_1347517 [Suillus variegatus]